MENFYEELPLRKPDYARLNRTRMELLILVDCELKNSPIKKYSHILRFNEHSNSGIIRVSSSKMLAKKTLFQWSNKKKTTAKSKIPQGVHRAQFTCHTEKCKTQVAACKYLQSSSYKLRKSVEELHMTSSIMRRKSKREPTQEEMLLQAPLISKRDIILGKGMIEIMGDSMFRTLESAFAHTLQPILQAVPEQSKMSPNYSYDTSSFSDSEISSPYYRSKL